MFTDDNPDDIVDLLLAHRPGDHFTTMGLREVSIPPRLLSFPCVLGQLENKGEPAASHIPDDEHGQYGGRTGTAGSRIQPPSMPAFTRQLSGDASSSSWA